MADQDCYICNKDLNNNTCVCIFGKKWLCENCYGAWVRWRDSIVSLEKFKRNIKE